MLPNPIEVLMVTVCKNEVYKTCIAPLSVCVVLHVDSHMEKIYRLVRKEKSRCMTLRLPQDLPGLNHLIERSG